MSKRQQERQRLQRKVRANLPHRTFREIKFDRDEIRQTIEPLSYNDARRQRGPIYEALEDELYREGCRDLPEFLRCLADKEKTLYESVIIRDRISDDRPLLYAVIDKLKEAELAYVRDKQKGFKQCFTLYYETMLLLEPYKQKYEYALSAIMERLVSLCHKTQGQERDAAEMIARIYFTFVEYLERMQQRANAISYLQITIDLVRGHVWTAVRDMPPGSLTLHELVAQKLARQLLLYGKQIVRHQPEEAIALARRATILVAEIGRQKNLDIFCETFMERAYFLMESSNYHGAHQCLEQIRPTVIACTEYRFVKLNIKFYLLTGQCAENFESPDKAISSYKKALRLSRLYNDQKSEANILLHLGKIFAKDTQKLCLAKKCYEQAKHIYIDFNDMISKKMVNYLLAKLMADEITPLYMAMLKASTKQYCAFFNLRQWKNRCRPFWKKLGDEIKKQEYEDIYCLLDEEKPDPSSQESGFPNEERHFFNVEED
ncbi:uncharacterized protein [Drosophila tropicalis]|uniref:uncharacterized protein n=1 Tax=Drosophila tropicalis TaxID=46794 RepID=UPI0035AB86A9